MNRYYGNSMGRFLTPDPYGGSAKLGRPNSWNRYAYVENDPVNKNDPSGLLLPGDYSAFDFGDFSFGTGWWYLYNSPTYYALGDPYFWQSQFGGGGGGGGGTAPPPPPPSTPFGTAQANLEAATGLIAAISDPSEACNQLFGKLGSRFQTVSAFVIAGNVQIADGTQSQIRVPARPGDLYGQLKDFLSGVQTLAEKFKSNPQSGAATIGGVTYINTPQINNNFTQTNASLLLHEALHYMGFSDNDIQSKFFGSTNRGDTNNITRAIQGHCFPRP